MYAAEGTNMNTGCSLPLAILALLVSLITSPQTLAVVSSTPHHNAKGVAAGVSVQPFVTFSDKNAFPMGMAVASDGKLFVSLFGTGSVRAIDQNGVVLRW